jgi:hypothetical protein
MLKSYSIFELMRVSITTGVSARVDWPSVILAAESDSSILVLPRQEETVHHHFAFYTQAGILILDPLGRLFGALHLLHDIAEAEVRSLGNTNSVSKFYSRSSVPSKAIVARISGQ